MDIETIRQFCLSLPHVTEDVKWDNDLCFLIGGKMFCVTGLAAPVKISIKVKAEEFDELTGMPGIIPAPYLAKHKWISVEDISALSRKELEHYVWQSYEMVKAKLPKKILYEFSDK